MRSKINRRLLISTMSLRAKRRELDFPLVIECRIAALWPEATQPYGRLAMTQSADWLCGADIR